MCCEARYGTLKVPNKLVGTNKHEDATFYSFMQVQKRKNGKEIIKKNNRCNTLIREHIV